MFSDAFCSPNTLADTLLQDQDNSEMAIKVFKKDEPTFDTNKLLLEDAWRVYVTDFLSTAPTIGTQIDQVHMSIMRRNMRIMTKNGTITPAFGADEEPSPFMRRFDLVKAKEGLEFKIAVEDLGIFFDINKDEYFSQPAPAREGQKAGVDDAEAATHAREDALQDSFVMNNDAMKGLSKEDVEGRYESFGALVKGGAAAAGDDSNKMES